MEVPDVPSTTPYKRSVTSAGDVVTQVTADIYGIRVITDIAGGLPADLTDAEARELRDALDEALYARHLVYPAISDQGRIVPFTADVA